MPMGKVVIVAGIALAGSMLVAPVSCNTGPCGGGDPSCFGPVLVVSSPADDLVSAAGCGRTAECSPSAPCAQLWVLPPSEGGVCDTIITFADGGTETVSFDWGSAHPGQCCGTSYDTNGGAVVVHGDASTD